MPGRPEGSAGGYSDQGGDDYDGTAWQDFTPWRPGDPSTRSEAPASYAADFSGEGLYRPALGDRGDSTAMPGARRSAGDAKNEPRGRWWTEDQPTSFESGDRVSSRSAVGGAFFSHVPKGTEGRITSTRSGLFGGDFATVEFENGYIEEVATSELKPEKGWF
ncbi:hypothetical protein [Amycolatopsis sp. NPDC050768]|uniref:hypothetical protein n=1 Tax=Amycolatopsis sp. NPDC050768 TaxID=3154839 RepID=UPI0033E5D0B3